MEGMIPTAPLISFNAIVDIDMTILRYIVNENVDQCIGLLSFDNINPNGFNGIIRDLYRRKYDNPLYYVMKDEMHKDKVDEVYSKILLNEDKYLEYAVCTNIYELFINFINSGDIHPTVLYDTEAQRKFLIDELDIDIKYMMSYREAKSREANIGPFTQYYFDRLEEVDRFMDVHTTTFYFSSKTLNLNEDGSDIKDRDKVNTILYNENKINLYDLYRAEMIGENDE